MRPVHVIVVAIALVASLAAVPVVAQGLAPYTVQVAALSDSDAAIDLSVALVREGYPAYVVRAEGAAGSVFRVRVGAFGDRGSADRYATTMGVEGGSEPRPALAEAIPSGILPLAPTRWFRIENGQRATVGAWGDTDRAARIVRDPAATPVYLLGDGTRFEAWWARALSDGGREEVVELALDADASADDEASVRDALFRQRLRLIAERGGFDFERLADEAVRGTPGARSLVVWRERPGVGEEIVRGVAVASADPSSRDAADWLGDVPPNPVEPLLTIPGEALDGTPERLEGDGWAARFDAPWTVLSVGETTWRALVGAPRFALDRLLVVRVAGGFEAVRLRTR